jgi:outer membrane protein OmpA-like peptidoglycan-associated protein
MKHNTLAPIALAMVIFLSACASGPTTTTQLESARNDYAQVLRNPDANSYAALEMKQASDAMQQANTAADKGESLAKVDQLAYLAQQKIALAQEAIKQKTSQAEMARAARERDQLQLSQRTNEANQAAATAQQAQRDAAEAQRKAEEARAATADAQNRAALLESQLADLAAKKTERGMVITLGDVLFATGQANLTASGLRTAQKLAEVLRQNPQRTVLVEGFTDSVGGDAYNQQLSERRGMAVRDALLQMGIGSERISVRGYGEAYPVASNDTAGNRQLNRRVEIVLSDDTGKIQQR